MYQPPETLIRKRHFFFVLFRRRKPMNFHYSLQQRAVMTRQESQDAVLGREKSVKDICRSEKHYLNVAYDENCDVSDDEGQFMVQVDLGKPRNKTPPTVSIHGSALVFMGSRSLDWLWRKMRDCSPSTIIPFCAPYCWHLGKAYHYLVTTLWYLFDNFLMAFTSIGQSKCVNCGRRSWQVPCWLPDSTPVLTLLSLAVMRGRTLEWRGNCQLRLSYSFHDLQLLSVLMGQLKRKPSESCHKDVKKLSQKNQKLCLRGNGTTHLLYKCFRCILSDRWFNTLFRSRVIVRTVIWKPTFSSHDGDANKNVTKMLLMSSARALLLRCTLRCIFCKPLQSSNVKWPNSKWSFITRTWTHHAGSFSPTELERPYELSSWIVRPHQLISTQICLTQTFPLPVLDL